MLLFLSSNIMNVPSRRRGNNCGFAFHQVMSLYMTLQGTARYILSDQEAQTIAKKNMTDRIIRRDDINCTSTIISSPELKAHNVSL